MELAAGEKEEILKHVGAVLEEFKTTRESLVPMLQAVQKKVGYLPELAMEKIAEGLDIPAVDVYGLATFYNQFRLNPPGRYQVKVCMGTACYMIGGKVALESFERRLDIQEGETTPDREFSLERVACVGCCSMAPVVLINDMVEGRVTPTRVDGLLLEYKNGEEKISEENKEEARTKGADNSSSNEEGERSA